MERLLGQYKNSNAIVKLYEDGTKIRETEDDDFSPAERPETIDVCISEYCTNDCSFCYAGCSKEGKHADFSKYERLLNSIPYLCEIAININSEPHPDLIPFLKRMKEQNVIVNATVNQNQFMDNVHYFENLTEKKLLHGLGISFTKIENNFIEYVQRFPDAIIHVINGIVTPDQIKALSDHNLKLLVLGYKQVGRGIDWYSKTGEEIRRRQNWVNNNLPIMAKHFNIISFDNLALDQLDVKRLISKEDWDLRFMGDDGSISFYLNLVQGYFAKNSLSSVHHPIETQDIGECFRKIVQ